MKKKIALPENFDTLSAEDKLKFFTEYEYDDMSDENVKLKASLDKASSEASAFKKQIRDKMSEDEKAKLERDEKERALMEELESLRTEKRETSYANKLMGVGYDAETAGRMAKSLPDGIADDFFENQRKFIESARSNAKAEALKGQPPLTPGGTPDPEKVKEAQEMERMRRMVGL